MQHTRWCLICLRASLPSYHSQPESSLTSSLPGVATAVEDGAALAEALDHARNPDDLARVLKVFEDVRVERAGQMQHASLIDGKLWHFADGPEQEARDLAMRPEVLGLPFEESPNQWSDRETQQWAYGYDAVQAVASALAAQNSGDAARTGT